MQDIDHRSITMASSTAEAAASMGMVISSAKQQQHQTLPPHPPPPAKKKRNLPGTPDPDAEVIALSPRTLLATNRFVCEICGKGFQRDQNLQLHRRGHNLPWKLRQRSSKEPPRKRVYVCPEATCVHHNPARALGDLTGIKKHFCRKHGEKKWKCDKCSKRYAVQSDWKAHAKTCGTREYRCDCGTLFSRRDSFITHRAFCDALAEETARLSARAAAGNSYHHHLFAATAAPQLPPDALSLWGGGGLHIAPPPQLVAPPGTKTPPEDLMGISSSVPSLFSGQEQHAKHAAPTDMSATALLHKAAQMGAVASSNAIVPLVQEPAAAEEECNDFVVDGGRRLLFAGTTTGQQSVGSITMSELTAAAGTMPFDAVLSAVRHGGQLKDAVLGIGREETRDFLGVGVQETLCSTSLNGWNL
ncbi:hypothetical protein BS78_03G001600 [Paspalum vaginatum]|nr:hypothetical protein BS78_03G001600 [Paspalum vaginatum]